ncbi:hypothetical protein E2320_002541 [Naja naja]|nr:hypothetical protein E2320_002541 [Naja naja]
MGSHRHFTNKNDNFQITLICGGLFLLEECYNGGIFDGIKCICDEDLYYGPKCEFLVHGSLSVTTSASITTSALSGEIRTTSTHPTGTIATPHPTIPNSTTSTAFTTSHVDILSTSTLPGRTQDLTTTLRMVVSNGTVASDFTTSWSGTKSPSSQGNTIMNDPSKNTPSREICLNGGIYDGIRCICNEDLFYGPRCEFLVDVIPVTELYVTITVKAQVKITNREYKKSLENLNSKYFQEIQAQFKKQMKDVYGAVPGYCEVEILRMRNGSIIVEHKVISQVIIYNNEEMIQHVMEVIIEAVKHSLKNIHTKGECIEPSGPGLCFVPLPNPILISSFSFNDTCKNIIDPKYADYYYPHIMEGAVRCVSRCFKGTQDSMNCFNGVCRISEIGLHCICNNLDMFWYLGSYCQLPIQKGVLGLSLALAVFFVISIILAICLIKAKRKKTMHSRSDDAACDKIGQRNPYFQNRG